MLFRLQHDNRPFYRMKSTLDSV